MKKQKVYLDYAATTPVDPRVTKAMLPFFSEKFGNTMSLHYWGQKAKHALNKSKKIVADLINAKEEEIIFTSSATESNNLVLKGVALKNKNKGNEIIISPIEHPSVLKTAEWLKENGFKIRFLSVNRYGLVDPKQLEKMINKKTILVSVMHANNEIGTIEPIKQLGRICKKRGIYFHTDASQTMGKIKIDVKEMNIDLLTGSSHKMYGPKGVGCLFIKKETKIQPILHGGAHERGLRPATVNVAGIVGFAKACEIAKKERKKEEKRIKALRDYLIKKVLKNIPESYLTGHPTKRLYNNASFWFKFVEGEAIVIKLDLLGIGCSSGSACSSKKLTPSHVLLAIGLKPYEAHGSLRISLGRWTTKKEIDYFIKSLTKVIKELRRISPFKKDYE